MKKILLFLITLLALSFYFPKHYFSSLPICDTPINSASNNPLSKENQQFLYAQLKTSSPEDFRYRFITFLEEEQHTYMVTNFINDDGCFDIKILVNDWSKLAGMRRTNGYSYPSELYDLKWEIRKIDEEEQVVYLDMHHIID